MLQIIGAVFIVSGCCGIGFYYRQRFHTALWHLRYMRQILEMFMSEIRYDKATLPECCRRVGAVSKEPYGKTLIQIYEEMQEGMGTSFFEKWKQNMDKTLKEIPLEAQEKQIFSELEVSSGSADSLFQLNVLERRRDLLDISIKNREENLEKQCRLASGLGIMSGLLLTILLI